MAYKPSNDPKAKVMGVSGIEAGMPERAKMLASRSLTELVRQGVDLRWGDFRTMGDQPVTIEILVGFSGGINILIGWRGYKEVNSSSVTSP